MLWVMPDLAVAAPLPSADEAVVVARYGRVDVATGRVRQKSRDGSFMAWTLPDGRVVQWRALREADGVVGGLYDAFGGERARVTLEAGRRSVTVDGLPPIDVTGWSEVRVGSLVVRLPEAVVDPASPSVARASVGLASVMVASMASAGDPRSDAYADEVVRALAGVLVDRSTAWIDGSPGVRLRVALVGSEQWAEVWAASSGDGAVLVVSASGPAGTTGVAAAVVALAARAEGA